MSLSEVQEVVYQVVAALCGYSAEEQVQDPLVERVVRSAAHETGHKANVLDQIESALRELQLDGHLGYKEGWHLMDPSLPQIYSVSPEVGPPDDRFMRDQATRLPCFSRSFDTDDTCKTCPGRDLCKVITDIRLSIMAQRLDVEDERRRIEIRKEEERKAAEEAARLNDALARQAQENEVEEAEPLEDLLARLDAAEPSGQAHPAARPFTEVGDVPDGTYCCVCKAKIKPGSRARMREGEGTYHIGCEGR